VAPEGGVGTHRYWQFPQPLPDVPPNPEERVRECSDSSVAAHLVSDVPVAAFLSGGLDSSAVVRAWRWRETRRTPSRPVLRVWRHGGRRDGPGRGARSRYGAELTPIDIRPEIRNIFERSSGALDEPHADDSASPTWLLSEAWGAATRCG